MAKRIILISSFPAFIILISVAFIIAGVGRGQPVSADIKQAKQNIFSLIDARDFAQGNSATEQLIADFYGSPGLDEAIHQIALKHQAAESYQMEIELSRYVIANWPKSEHAVWAQMDIVMANVLLNNDATVQAEIEVLKANYKDDPNLPWTLSILGHTCMVSLKYEIAEGIFEDILQKYPRSSYASEAQLYLPGTKVLSLIYSGDFAGADTALSKLEADFSGHPNLPEMLYWIADRYTGSNRFGDARRVCQQVIQKYPDSSWAGKAVLDIRRLEIWDVLDACDINEVEALMDEFVADFNQHPYAGECLRQVAMKAYRRGMKLMYDEGQWDKAQRDFERAAVAWRWVIDGLDGEGDGKAAAYCYAGNTYQQMRRWEEAIEHYRIVVDKWPESEHACGAQAAVGWCYEALRNEGKIAKEQAEAIIEEAYTAVLADYPDCYVADYVAYRLGEMMLARGDKASAARYYRKFLESTYPENERIAEVQAKVKELERVRPGSAVETDMEGTGK